MLPEKVVYKVISELIGEEVLERYKGDYESRIIVQKLIYIFQEISDEQGFNYSWYMIGPYSTQLTSKLLSVSVT